MIGFTHNRASQSDRRDRRRRCDRAAAGGSWEVAGSLFVAGTTAYAAIDRCRSRAGDTVVVAGAAGGVGSLAVQLAKRAGATVIGLASERNHGWLQRHGVIPVRYGEGVADRISDVSPGPVDAFFDTVGGDYVSSRSSSVCARPDRHDRRLQAPEKYGVKMVGNMAGASAEMLGISRQLVAGGELEVPIARRPTRAGAGRYASWSNGHTHGKIVLRLWRVNERSHSRYDRRAVTDIGEEPDGG